MSIVLALVAAGMIDLHVYNFMVHVKPTDAAKPFRYAKGRYIWPNFNGHRVILFLSTTGFHTQITIDGEPYQEVP